MALIRLIDSEGMNILLSQLKRKESANLTQLEEQLLQLASDDQHLLSLALQSRIVRVSSDSVQIYDESPGNGILSVTEELQKQNGFQAKLMVSAPEMLKSGDRMTVIGVDGYTPDGQRQTVEKNLILYVKEIAEDSFPIVAAMNGRKNNPEDEFSTIPRIPGGTGLVVLTNAMEALQPEEGTSYRLSKSVLSGKVRHYLSARKNDVAMKDADLAERELKEYARSKNRELWFSNQGIIYSNDRLQPPVCSSNPGLLAAYTKKVVTGDLTSDKFIATARVFFDLTDEDSAVFFASKSLYRDIMRLAATDLSASFIMNELGWQVLRAATPYGIVDVVYEQELDSVPTKCSGAMIGKNSIITYSKPQDSGTGDIVVTDFTHFSGGAVLVAHSLCKDYEDDIVFIWDSADIPAKKVEGSIYYFLADCPAVSPQAKGGQYWKLAIDEDDEGNMVYKWNKDERYCL